MAANSKRGIEYRALDELLGCLHPQNAKNHDLGAIIESYKVHGYVASGVLDDRTGLFLAGHGRIRALAAMKRQHMDAPDGIRNGGDDWHVPVQVGYASANDIQALAYLAADNKLTIAGGWDEPALAELLQEIANSDEIALSASGFDAEELDDLLRDLGQLGEPPEDPGAQVDRAAELNEKWQVQRGDVWQVGRHKILCGDSTCAEDVDKLMDGVKADLMVTDPPYGVNYERGKFDGTPRKSNMPTTIQGDNLSGESQQSFICDVFSIAKNVCKNNAVVYMFSAPLREGAYSMFGLLDTGLHVQSQLIWNKSSLVLGRCDYHWKHEICWYGYWDGAGRVWNGERTQVSIIDAPKISASLHPNEKPVPLFCIFINNSSHKGMIIYDPFLGGGTTLVACEQTGRVGYGMEISADYVAVCLERLTGMGLEVVRLTTSNSENESA